MKFIDTPSPGILATAENPSGSRNMEFALRSANLPKGWSQDCIPVKISANSDGEVWLALTAAPGSGLVSAELEVILLGDDEEEYRELVTCTIQAPPGPVVVEELAQETPENVETTLVPVSAEPELVPELEDDLPGAPPVELNLESATQSTHSEIPIAEEVEAKTSGAVLISDPILVVPVSAAPPAPTPEVAPPPLKVEPKVVEKAVVPPKPRDPVEVPPANLRTTPKAAHVEDVSTFGTISTGQQSSLDANQHTPKYGEQAKPAAEHRDRLQDSHPVCVIDPVHSQMISLGCGESVLVVFNFKNSTGKENQCYVEWNDKSLPAVWKTIKPEPKGIVSERDSVNVQKDDFNDVGFWIKIPEDALPHTYRIPIETGVRDGSSETLELQIRVEPKPAILVSVETPKIWRGPFARRIEVPVEVQNVGNAPSAYRLLAIGVENKQRGFFGTPSKKPGTRRGLMDVLRHRPAAEVPKWNLSWDRELDELPAPSIPGVFPTHTHILSIVRDRLWWWGFQDSLKISVEGAVVTDRAEVLDGKNRKVVDVSLRRVVPLAWFLAAPIALFVAVMLGSSFADLTISSDLEDLVGTQYILAKEIDNNHFKIPVQGQAPLMALTKISVTLTAGSTTMSPQPVHGIHRGNFGVSLDAQLADDSQHVYSGKAIISRSSLFGSYGGEKSVDLIPICTNGLLSYELYGEGKKLDVFQKQYSTKAGRSPETVKNLEIEKWFSGKKEDDIGNSESIIIPKSVTDTSTKFKLNLKNNSARDQINVWLLKESPPGLLTANLMNIKGKRLLKKEITYGKDIDVEATIQKPQKGENPYFILLTTDQRLRFIKVRFDVDGSLRESKN